MGWIKDFFIEDEEPELGDERIRSGFLWLPKAVRGETRWWVQAAWRERYVWTQLGRGRKMETWRGVAWIDEEDGLEGSSEPSVRLPRMEHRFVEAVLRGGPYDGAHRKLHPEASSIELVSEVAPGRLQVEEYELVERDERRFVLAHVRTRTVDQGGKG